MAAGKKLTQDEFITRAKEVHGDEYDYSKVVYKNASTDITIICPIHGEFIQRPAHHLKGCGCPKCSSINAWNKSGRKVTTEDFIRKAKETHGDKYDYSEVVYKDSNTKVTIVCPEHGQFDCKPSNHLSGKGCPKCVGKYKTTEDFIAQAKAVHGDKYDYSKTVYVNSYTPICVICPEHGQFTINPSRLLNGAGCRKCASELRWKNKRLSTEEFIERAKTVHGDKYDYSKTKCGKSTDKVCIICPEHGHFMQHTYDHLKGQGCPKCLGKNKTTEEFVTELKEQFGNKYDYSKVEYVNANTEVTLICPKHGPFTIKPVYIRNNKSGILCPKCKAYCSSTEEFIDRAMTVHGDKYDYSEVNYINTKKDVCIICPKHGPFWQNPVAHLNGCGCRKCTHPNANMTTEEFIDKAKAVHGDKYDYSMVEYKGISEKVCIICHEIDDLGKEHGPFWQSADGHLQGRGCRKCNGKYSPTTKEFIEQAKAVHGDKYDYSMVEYITTRTKVCIICPEHGEFWQIPKLHLNGAGCPNCVGLRKEYKFNLLHEFVNENEFRAFLANNDVNILQLILGSLCELEPKYAPLERDIQRALANASNTDPIEALEQKYSTESENETEPTEAQATTNESESVQLTATIDLGNDNDVYAALAAATEETTEEQTEPSIEDVIRNDEQELQVINRIEHMLTPEIRSKIMNKYLNDKRRAWMAARETNK